MNSGLASSYDICIEADQVCAWNSSLIKLTQNKALPFWVYLLTALSSQHGNVSGRILRNSSTAGQINNRCGCTQGDHSTGTMKIPDISLTVSGTPAPQCVTHVVHTKYYKCNKYTTNVNAHSQIV